MNNKRLTSITIAIVIFAMVLGYIQLGYAAPTYESQSASNNVYGESCTFSLRANASLSGGNLSYYIFWTNNTGTWTNDAPVLFTNAMFTNTTAAWAIVTKTLTSHVALNVDDIVQYRFDVNDTAGNWLNSTIASITLTGSLKQNWNVFLTQIYVVVGMIGLVPIVLIMFLLFKFKFDAKTMIALIFAIIVIIVCILIILLFITGIASSST